MGGVVIMMRSIFNKDYGDFLDNDFPIAMVIDTISNTCHDCLFTFCLPGILLTCSFNALPFCYSLPSAFLRIKLSRACWYAFA